MSEGYIEYLKKRYQSNPSVMNYLQNNSNNKKSFFLILKNIKKFIKTPIPNSVIEIFYDDPKTFFVNSQTLLKNTSLYDISGNSIFIHYFNALYNINNPNYNYYENYFPTFFGAFGQFMSMQDEALETPVHKLLVKFKNKKFFLQIFKKLFDLGYKDLFTIKNWEKENCFDIIINYILNYKNKIFEKNEFDLFANFVNAFPNLKDKLPFKNKIRIDAFLSKVTIDENNYKSINIAETLENLTNLLNSVKDKKEIFHILYEPNTDINYLNLIFDKCITIEHFNKLFDFLFQLFKIQIEQFFDNIGDLHYIGCFHHIDHVIKKMGKRSKLIGENDLNYGMRILSEIIPFLLKNENSIKFWDIIFEKNTSPTRKKNLEFQNKGIINNLVNNSSIILNKKIEIYKSHLMILNQHYKILFEDKNVKKEFLLLNLIINKDSVFNSDYVLETYKLIFDDFYFVGMLYLEIYILCEKYKSFTQEYSIQKLNDFLIKNKSDLFSQYKKIYGFTDDKIDILLEFIIKYEKKYIEKYGIMIKDLTDIYSFLLGKNVRPFNIWYSKFILTEPDILKSFLIDIGKEKDKFERIESPLLKEKSEKLNSFYDDEIKMTFFRLLLLVKYNLEEISKSPNTVTFFGNELGNNYLINFKNEIHNSLSSISNEGIFSLVKNCKDNPETLIFFLDENNEEISDEMYMKRIKYNINSLMKISEETKLIENIRDKVNWEINIDIKKANNLYKFLIALKKQKISFVQCVKNNLNFFKSIFNFLIRYYNYISTNEKMKRIFSQKEYDIFFDEINECLNIYYKEKYENKGIELYSIFKIISEDFPFWKKNILPHISVLGKKILNNNWVDYTSIEKAINSNIFFICYLLMNGEASITENEDIKYIKSLDFSNSDKYYIKFFFEYFLNVLNPSLGKKYYYIYLLLNSFINGDGNLRTILIEDTSLFKEACKENYYINNFGIVMLYIFLKKKFPNYNAAFLFYIYRILAEKEPKTIYSLLNKMFDPKIKIKDLEKHLCLIKNEEIPKNLYEKIKYNLRGKKHMDLISKEFIKLYMNNYLIDLEYNNDSFIKLYIEKYSLTENIHIIKSILFNYSLFNYSSDNNYKQIISLFLEKGHSLYEILITEKSEENNMVKKIKILLNLFKYISQENITYIPDKFGWQNSPESNWFFGLITFLKIIKKENINIFFLIQKNIVIIYDTIITLCNFRKCLLYQKIRNETKDKVEFALNEIHQILYNFISSKEFGMLLSQNIEDENNNETIKNKLGINILTLVKYYKKNFYEEMLDIKNTKVKLNSNFEQFQAILTNIINIPHINELISLNDYSQILVHLFHKDTAKFFSLLSIFKEHLINSSEQYKYNLMISFLKKSVEKFFKNLPKIQSFIKAKNDWYTLKNNLSGIIAYILNNSIQAIYSKLDFVIKSEIFNDIDKSYNILIKIKNKEASLFVLKIIENKFNKKNNVQKILDIMDRVIYNEFIIDYLFNSSNENDLKELIKSGKYTNKIIIALFKFSEINGYLFIKKVLSLINKYTPQFDLKNLIIPPTQEPYENIVDIKQIIQPADEEDIIYIKMRYLLYYSLNHRMINNYETIAVLLEFVQLNDSVEFLIEDLMGNIDNILMNPINKIEHLEFFLNAINNKNIKELGNKFYSFIVFIDSIIKEKEHINNFSDIEKYIFINYIKIFILEIFPKHLEIFLENDKELNDYSEIQNKTNSKNMMLSYNENKLMTLLALYQIKGNPLLDIKSVYPTFYSKIENFVNSKCKSLNINSLSIKKESDMNKFNKIKNILLTEYNFFILWRYPFNICQNFMNVIKVRRNPNVDSSEYIIWHEYSIETSIINLLKGIDVKPIYLTKDKNSIISYDIETKYKPYIDSLNDFKQSCLYIINNIDNIKDEFEKKKRFKIFISYLEHILSICRYISKKYRNNENYKANLFLEKLPKSEENKLNEIKNTIDIKDITLTILNIYQQENQDLFELYNALKLWILDYFNKNEAMKELNKISKEPLNILSYFKYLELSCFIIHHFVEIFDKYIEIRKDEMMHHYLKYEKHYMFKKKEPKEEMNKFYNDLRIKINDILNIKESYNEYYNLGFRALNKNGIVFPLYYYFNEEKENFIEVFTYEYPYINRRELFVAEYLNYCLEAKSLQKKYDNDEIKNKFYETLSDIVSGYGFDVNEKNLNYFKNLFEPMYNKFNNYITAFFANVVETKKYKSFFDFEQEIINEFKINFVNNIYPALKFNQNLSIFLHNLDYFKNNKDMTIETFVDFSELIKSVYDTKYHPNEKLDTKFKLNAVNYIINDNSNISYFIQYLYSIIYSKRNKANCVLLKRSYNNTNIKEYFTIKIQSGRKFDINDAKKILYINSSNDNFQFKNNDKIFFNGKSKIYFSLVTNNIFKRINVPIVNYSGHIPYQLINSGKTVEDELSHAFLNTSMTWDKTAIMKKVDKNKKKINKKKKEYINIFELMYSVKSVENNSIILEKNDVSKILKNYSDNDDGFYDFIGHSFSERKNEKVFIDWDKIKFNWKFN